MSILTRKAILQLIDEKKVIVSPFDSSQVGPASIDLHLDNDFRVFKNIYQPIDMNEEVQIEDVTEDIYIEDDDFFLLMPGKSCLGITVEQITLPSNISGWLQGRSRFARFGLIVHATASFIQPGVSNKQVLEFTNMGEMPLKIIPKVKICQIILQECVGNAEYSGKYKDQIKP
ncbi:MAG: dCTP deaminase [Anaerolineaceae bacterium]|nr:dCTP deaminase [Anaerolineaceae bacterium]